MPPLFSSLLTLAFMLLGFYVIIWGAFPRLKHPNNVIADSIKWIITSIWKICKALLSFPFSSLKTARGKRVSNQKTYDQALSLTTLDSKVIKRPSPVTHTQGRWNTHLEHVSISPSRYYSLLIDTIEEKGLSDISVSYFYARQSGLFSPKRKYLRIRRERHLVEICAAPFGSGIFVSLWIGVAFPGLLGFFARLPIIGPVIVWIMGRYIKPATYYRLDTLKIFISLIESAIAEVNASLTGEDTHQSSPLSEKPFLKELYGDYDG